MTNPLDDRIAAALRAAADQVTEQDLRPQGSPRTPRRRSGNATRWVYPFLAAAVVAGIVILSVVLVNNRHSKTSAAGPSISPSLSVTRTPSVSTSGPGNSPTNTLTTPSKPVASRTRVASTGKLGSSYCFFGDLGCKGFHTYYVPMWPAANIGQADDLADAYAAHCDVDCPSIPVSDYFQPGATALDFVQSYLDFRDITRVTSTKIAKDQAHIGVGYLNPAGKPVTAAVIHLVRYEHNVGDTTAPWEVVGSDDTTFSLETPKYSSDVGNSFTAGGHITGVDENITVSVLHTAGTEENTTTTLTDQCCLPAGGENSPWSVHLTIPQNAGLQVADALTIVASTGGHIQQHERFAVQGVYVQS